MPHRRFGDDFKGATMDSPLVLLGQLHTKVQQLERDTGTQTDLLLTISADIQQMKIDKAQAEGGKMLGKALIKCVEFTITISASIIAAMEAVKAMAKHGN